mgnify:CR=1 FL=1
MLNFTDTKVCHSGFRLQKKVVRLFSVSILIKLEALLFGEGRKKHGLLERTTITYLKNLTCFAHVENIITAYFFGFEHNITALESFLGFVANSQKQAPFNDGARRVEGLVKGMWVAVGSDEKIGLAVE